MSTVDTIKERLTIEEVVSTYVKLEKAGANLKGVCPFHNEKTPSFFVSPNRGSYYCFGCGAKGDIFSFVEQFEGVDFRGALKILAARAGVEIVKEDPKNKDERERLFKALELAALMYHKQLSENTEAKEYLKKRGVEANTFRNFRLGYAPNEWRTLHTFLIGKGFTSEELVKAGLAKAADKGYYDTFRSRIVFPISDVSGRIVAFSGRIFPPDEEIAKYLNSPETALFNKSAVLYGYDRAKFEIRKRGIAVLVEGQMDLIMSHQIGVTNAIATSGTAFTGFHAQAIKRFAPKLIISFDGDSAGQQAALRAAKIALPAGLDVRIAELPEGKDPADMCANEKEGYLKALENAVHVVEFALNIILQTTVDLREQGKLIVKEVLPLIKSMVNAVEQAHFIRLVSTKSSIREDALWEDLKRLTVEVRYDTPEAIPAKKIQSTQIVERRLFSALYFLEGYDKDQMKKFQDHVISIIGQEVFDRLKEEFEGEKQELLFDAERHYDDPEYFKREINELLERLKDRNFKSTMKAAANESIEKANEILLKNRKKDLGNSKK